MKKSILALVLLTILGTSCKDPIVPPTPPAEKYNAAIISDWIQNLADFTRSSQIEGPKASRIYAYCGIAFYEGYRFSNPSLKSLAGQLNELDTPLPLPDSSKLYNWQLVATVCERAVADYLFTDASTEIKQAITSLAQSHINATATIGLSQEIVNNSIDLGEDIGAAIIIWAQGDDYSENTEFCTYTLPAPASPGDWKPTPPNLSAPLLLPCWNNMRYFVFNPYNVAQDCGIPCPQYSTNPSTPYYIDQMEVFTTVNSLTDVQKETVDYWNDGSNSITPAGHSLSMLRYIILQQDIDMEQAAIAFAKTGIALADGYIACWATKYNCTLERPITFIRATIDANWNSYLVNPLSPEYSSEHSVELGAMAQVVAQEFGSVAITDSTYKSVGKGTRTFATFDDAVNEAAMSRLYAGVHTRASIVQGLYQGRCIGQKVNELDFE